MVLHIPSNHLNDLSEILTNSGPLKAAIERTVSRRSRPLIHSAGRSSFDLKIEIGMWTPTTEAGISQVVRSPLLLWKKRQSDV